MLFDQARELPVATIRRAPQSWLDRTSGDFVRWLAARWQWLRPRSVPLGVALVGMLGVIQAVNYLAHPPEVPAAADDGTPNATMYIDGVPYHDGTPLPDLPTSAYRVRVVLHP